MQTTMVVLQQAEVLEPSELRLLIKEELRLTKRIYKNKPEG